MVFVLYENFINPNLCGILHPSDSLQSSVHYSANNSNAEFGISIIWILKGSN